MKKAVVVPALLMVVVIMIGADMRKNAAVLAAPANVKKKPCYGYTIIEFGKGINCNGDTIKLEKVMGGQELAKHIQLSGATLASR
jgi:hypothetical protein